jgi:hypothetical protein
MYILNITSGGHRDNIINFTFNKKIYNIKYKNI